MVHYIQKRFENSLDSLRADQTLRRVDVIFAEFDISISDAM